MSYINYITLDSGIMLHPVENFFIRFIDTCSISNYPEFYPKSCNLEGYCTDDNACHFL